MTVHAELVLGMALEALTAANLAYLQAAEPA